MKSSRLPEFDVLRVAAMFYIVGFLHLFDYFEALRGLIHTSLAGMLARVALGVFVFISAYLLASRNKMNSWQDVRIFLNRRFLRIYPLFFLALIAFWMTNFIGPRLFILSALLVTLLTPRDLMTLWFVTMLFLFYLLTPLYLWKSSIVKTGLSTVLLFGGLLTVHHLTGWTDLRLPMYLLVFVAGIVAAQYPSWWSKASNFWVIAVGAALFVLMYQFAMPPHVEATPKTSGEIFWSSLAILGILPLLMPLSRFGARLVRLEPLLVVSNASFAMYLLHRLTYDFLLKIYHPQSLALSLAYAYCVMVPITFLLAFGVQKAYDSVLIRFFSPTKLANPSLEVKIPLA